MKLLLILKILPVTLFRAPEALNFYPKNAYRNPPSVLKYHRSCLGENQPVKSLFRNYDAAFGTILRSDSKGFQRSKQNIYSYFSRRPGMQPKMYKPAAPGHKVHKPSKNIHLVTQSL
jgi:hypothetical protein